METAPTHCRVRQQAVRRRRDDAFTLIELLLVLVILAILAAVVVPKFSSRSQQAKESAAKTDIANMETAFDAFEIDTGRYPTSDEGIAALVNQPSNANGWKGPYLKKMVAADPWGNAYVYRSPGAHNPTSYDLFSMGADGREGGPDDITNWAQ